VFDIGFWEIFLILVLALIVIGPERLPGAARTAGYWIGRARRFVEGVKSDVEQEFDVAEFKRLMHNQEVQLNELRRKLAEAGDLSGSDQPGHGPGSEPGAKEYEAILHGDKPAASEADADAPRREPGS
jgi:sec-independent protein translocase protein TatB